MTSKLWPAGALAVCCAVAAAASVPPPKAGAARCTAKTLTGAYGFSVRGTNLRVGEFAIVGHFVSDGSGSVQGSAAQTVNGTISRGAITGTYTVEADCTGTASLTATGGNKTTMNFVIVNGGADVFLLVVDPGIIESGTAKRI
jgi:hypothetical protein